MLFRTPIQLLFYLFTLILSTSQVNITITFALCDCLPERWSLRLRSVADLVLTVQFNHLLAWDVAAVSGVYLPAEHARDNDSRHGLVGATRAGPGTWEWAVLCQDEDRHFAVRWPSFISLPRRVPRDPSRRGATAPGFKYPRAQIVLVDGAGPVSSLVHNAEEPRSTFSVE
ncbi:MAG: hypothetical protein Q9185_000565 [Variospora sp. 1 TL-2023]